MRTFSSPFTVDTIYYPFSHFKLKGNVTYYNNSFFGFDETGAFLKISRNGHEIWKMPRHVSLPKKVIIAFDRIVFLESNGSLVCFNAQWGFPVWKKDNMPIQKMEFHYPHLFFLNDTKKMGAIDFLSGVFLWEEGSFLDMVFFQEKGMIAGLTRENVILFDPFSGKQLARIPFPFSNMVFEASKDTLAAKNETTLVYYQEEQRKWASLKELRIQNLWFLNEKVILIQYNDGLNWKLVNWAENKIIWQKTLGVSNEERLHFFPPFIIRIIQNQECQLYGFLKGQPLYPPIPGNFNEDLLNVIAVNHDLYFVLESGFLFVRNPLKIE